MDTYIKLRGKGMNVSLFQGDDMAVLTIRSSGQRIEVRGQPGVGSDYQNGFLDQVIDAIPRRANISSLYAGETLHLHPDLADPIIDALERISDEEELDQAEAAEVARLERLEELEDEAYNNRRRLS